MTTYSVNTVIDHTSDAGFRTWGNELMAALITSLGLTQTADTGQLAFPMTATTRPISNTAAGYYILRFNDTLQATTPIFMKIELGTGGGATIPQLWLTVGTGSNGSGTITGLNTRTVCGYSAAPASTVTNYQSRACYNTTQGVLWIDWKQGAPSAASSMLGFMIIRSVDNTGAPTSAAVGCQTASPTTTSGTNQGGPWSWYQASNTTWNGPVTASGFVWNQWCYVPYANTSGGSSLAGTAGLVYPCFQFAPTASVPGVGITNALALAWASEVSYNSTVTLTILGSLSMTYMAGGLTSSVAGGGNQTASPTTGVSILRLWQ